MSDFAARHGYKRELPARVILEQSSEDLVMTLWKLITDDLGNYVSAYRLLCDYLRRVPDRNIWSDQYAEGPALSLLESLDWMDIYQFLENLYAGEDVAGRRRIQGEANRSLERSGIAYEMRNGAFEVYDPEADALGIRHSEDDALESLTGAFAPVRVQYQKALDDLHRIPADYEGALGNALNSLEAVTKIVTGELSATLSAVAPRLFPNGEGYHQPLREAIIKLYAYSNQLPGGRHGRYADPKIAYVETAMVVRIVGAVMAFLIADYRDVKRLES